VIARCSRREALRLAGAGALGLLLARCAPAHSPAPWKTTRGPFPLLEVSGTPWQIGYAHGKGFRSRIHQVLGILSERWEACRRRANDPAVRRFREATGDLFPRVLEEIEGIAEGAGLDAAELFAWNCRSELDVLAPGDADGCSTIGMVRDGKVFLAHNEDGHGAYHGRMILLLARPEGSVPFLSLVYPGTIPGVGPGINARGVVQTTNYIGPGAIPGEGVPRYVLGRAILEAGSLDEAIRIATTRPRAFPWHHNLADLPGGRLVSVETWPANPEREDLLEITDEMAPYVHTNHLVHPRMRGLPERRDYMERSSLPRYRALADWLASNPPPREIDDLLAALSIHEGEPTPVCRHADDGRTLATGLFASPEVEMTLVTGPPCQGVRHAWRIPADA